MNRLLAFDIPHSDRKLYNTLPLCRRRQWRIEPPPRTRTESRADPVFISFRFTTEQRNPILLLRRHPADPRRRCLLRTNSTFHTAEGRIINRRRRRTNDGESSAGRRTPRRADAPASRELFFGRAAFVARGDGGGGASSI